MSEVIDKYISQNNVTEALAQCLREQQYHLGSLLARIFQTTHDSANFQRVHLQLNDTLTGIPKDGQDVDVKENIVNEENPPLLEAASDGEDDSSDLLLDEGDKIIAFKKCQVQNSWIAHTEKSTLKTSVPKTRVLLLCNWCESEQLCKLWNKMSQGDYTWNNIQIVWEEPCDYYVVINCPPITIFPDTRKTLFFHMEPRMAENKNMWGDWGTPPKDSFLFCGTHDQEYNNNEWHLSKTYKQLCEEQVVKDEDVAQILSTVLSDKYKDPGHILRIDFTKFLERKGLEVHVYGGDKFGWKDYKGSLPPHEKDKAVFPYKYVFNAENHEIRNYYTEKLIDGILAECLVFYWGCPNIRDFFDERALVQLKLEDFEQDFAIIKKAIDENWWAERLVYIKKEKQRILDYYQFFPRLERIINNGSKQQNI